ncbi:Mur ligase domain-containing protein [Georgenia sp. SUBG003]|uniref:Mur ligase domain-containing protein n=1 Tax=Georgenia sp. SUBG003 TaxID=1497974 RepID=UPI003AB5101D
MTLAQVAAVTGGELAGQEGVPVTGDVVTDSRAVAPGALFAAFAGEHVDGHDYVTRALDAGAAGALVSRPVAHSHHARRRNSRHAPRHPRTPHSRHTRRRAPGPTDVIWLRTSRARRDVVEKLFPPGGDLAPEVTTGHVRFRPAEVLAPGGLPGEHRQHPGNGARHGRSRGSPGPTSAARRGRPPPAGGNRHTGATTVKTATKALTLTGAVAPGAGLASPAIAGEGPSYNGHETRGGPQS